MAVRSCSSRDRGSSFYSHVASNVGVAKEPSLATDPGVASDPSRALKARLPSDDCVTANLSQLLDDSPVTDQGVVCESSAPTNLGAAGYLGGLRDVHCVLNVGRRCNPSAR